MAFTYAKAAGTDRIMAFVNDQKLQVWPEGNFQFLSQMRF